MWRKCSYPSLVGVLNGPAALENSPAVPQKIKHSTRRSAPAGLPGLCHRVRKGGGTSRRSLRLPLRRRWTHLCASLAVPPRAVTSLTSRKGVTTAPRIRLLPEKLSPGPRRSLVTRAGSRAEAPGLRTGVCSCSW